MLFLCYLTHCSTDGAILADEKVKIWVSFIQANTKQTMSTKLLDYPIGIYKL